ncbi:unnamed protein product [Durusdinium trenchii]|uniref:Uncharacterized protein n=2 Tax=Durusdinium trenchii TaxID=1381693 RepID=A0ABP0HND7_9DINO
MMPHFGEHLRSPLWAVGIKRGSRQDAGETVVQVYVTYDMQILFIFFLALSETCYGLRSTVQIDPPSAVSCHEGDTKEGGCRSLCRWLDITLSSVNGQCDVYVKMLEAKGYKNRLVGRPSSMAPIVKVLMTNIKEEAQLTRSQVLLRQIDLVPEQKRTGKYLNEIEELRNRVMKLLKQKEPDFDPPSASCQEGDTQVEGCQSVCRWLDLTKSSTNGQCDDYVKSLEAKGYKKYRKWKIFGHPSPMDPVLGLLTSNCRKEELSFYLAGLAELIKKMKKEGKIDRYQEELEELQKHVTDTLEVQAITIDEDYEDDTEPLPRCDLNMPVEAGDIVTFEVGGPDFEKDVSQTLTQMNAEAEALRLNKLTFSYGPHFDYSNTFNTSSPEKETVNETKGAKAKRYTVLGLKHGANAFVKVCKAFADVGWNLLKGIGDLGIFLGKVVGKSAVWTGAKVTALYAHVRQTTPHTDKIHWTHTELAIGKNQLQAAVYPDGVQEQDLCWMGEPKPRSGYGVRGDQIIISRFVGDGTLDAQKYRTLAAERAKMWAKHLKHYSDTVGQWHRAVFGNLGHDFSKDFGKCTLHW